VRHSRTVATGIVVVLKVQTGPEAPDGR
jgi:hypothetical protein